ncbi:MAG TPA: HAD-IA family hydrolase [Spirochaetia bacterium]
MPLTVRAVLFDFDATLTKPGAHDYPAIRAALSCPPRQPILEFIASLPTEEEKARANAILVRFEDDAARASVPNHGAETVVRTLARRGLKTGILTRNTLKSIRLSLRNFAGLTEKDFDVIVTREAAGRPKPHPDGVLEAARRFGVRPGEMLMVGDFVYDIAAGKAAGATAILVTNGGPALACDPAPDYTIATLPEILDILGA